MNAVYFLTVKNTDSGQRLVEREPFEDYGEAMRALSSYLRPRNPRSVLVFSTELINGEFARTFMQVRRPEDLDPKDPLSKQLRPLASKQANAYDYDCDYLFIIESEYGAAEADRIRANIDADD